MGNISTKKTKLINESKIKNDYINFKVCSFNVRLTQTTNYQEKIKHLINFVVTSDIDVLCLQGIKDSKILRLISLHIKKYNKRNDNKIIMHPIVDDAFVDLNNQDSDDVFDVLKVTWGNSDNTDLSAIDTVILSRYPIITKFQAEVSHIIKYKNRNFYIININFHGIIISIYNAMLQNDYIGISNSSVRRNQVSCLLKAINKNISQINSDEIYSKYDYRNIHIVCCNSDIMELCNNEINNEYLAFTRILNALDTYRYIRTLKNKQANQAKDSTNVGGTRTNYILLAGLNTKGFETISNIGKSLISNNKLLIINASIFRDITSYEDRPVITHFILKKIQNPIQRNPPKIITEEQLKKNINKKTKNVL